MPLKVVADRWVAAGSETREASFEAAFAVRQLENGLAALLNIAFGLILAVLGVAILSSTRYPAWLGTGGLLVAPAMLASGAAMASTGFSGVAMSLSMLAILMFLVRIMLAAVRMWQLAPHLTER